MIYFTDLFSMPEVTLSSELSQVSPLYMCTMYGVIIMASRIIAYLNVQTLLYVILEDLWLPYIANHLKWKCFVVFVDRSVTAKLFQ